MAEVQKIDEVLPVEAVPEKYVLTLNRHEAEILRAVLGKIAGDGSHPVRIFTDALYGKLFQLGVKPARGVIGTITVHAVNDRGFE